MKGARACLKYLELRPIHGHVGPVVTPPPFQVIGGVRLVYRFAQVFVDRRVSAADESEWERAGGLGG